MSWQDAVLTFGGLGFILGLLPTVLGPDKPARLTSIAQGLTLLTFSVTYFTLDLVATAVTTTVNAALWLVIFWQAR